MFVIYTVMDLMSWEHLKKAYKLGFYKLFLKTLDITLINYYWSKKQNDGGKFGNRRRALKRYVFYLLFELFIFFVPEIFF